MELPCGDEGDGARRRSEGLSRSYYPGKTSVVVGFTRLDIRGGTWAADITMGISSLGTEFKSVEMNEITRKSVDREGGRRLSFGATLRQRSPGRRRIRRRSRKSRV